MILNGCSDKSGQFNKCRKYKSLGNESWIHGLNSSTRNNNTATESCSRYSYDHSEFKTTIVTEVERFQLTK